MNLHVWHLRDKSSTSSISHGTSNHFKLFVFCIIFALFCLLWTESRHPHNSEEMSTGSCTLLCVALHGVKTCRDARRTDGDPSISAFVVSTQILGSICRMFYSHLAFLSPDTTPFKRKMKSFGSDLGNSEWLICSLRIIGVLRLHIRVNCLKY
jgi:hypothetical protein